MFLASITSIQRYGRALALRVRDKHHPNLPVSALSNELMLLFATYQILSTNIFLSLIENDTVALQYYCVKCKYPSITITSQSRAQHNLPPADMANQDKRFSTTLHQLPLYAKDLPPEQATNWSLNRPEYFNFATDIVDRWAKDNPHHTAMLWVSQDMTSHSSMPFQYLSNQSQRVAFMLKKPGIKQSDSSTWYNSRSSTYYDN